MSFLGKLLGFGKSSDTEQAQSGTGVYYLGDTLVSPRKMTPKQALAISTVYAAVKILSETIGSLKVEVYQKKGNDINPAVDHPLHYLINSEPNEIYSSMTFFETNTLRMTLKGNGYSYINRHPGTAEIESLDLLDAEVIPFISTSGRLYYRDVDNKITYRPDELLHFKNMSQDGVNGMTPLEHTVHTLHGAAASKEFADQVYTNGAFIGGVLETDKALNKEQELKLKNSWTTAYSGRGNTGKTAVLEHGLKYKQVRMKPSDIELIKAMEYSDKDIARIFRVPLHLLQSLERSTNNNIEQQAIDFVTHTVRPLVKRFEGELNRKLFTATERKQGYFIRFNIDSLLRGDIKSRGEFYKTMFHIGAMSQNDVRKLENLNPIEGGDKYYVMINMADSKTGKQLGNGEE